MSLFTLQTRDQSQYGPVELDTLRGWVREGRVLPEDQIYDHASMKWVPAMQLAPIADLLLAADTKDPSAKTQYQDPLSRMEHEVATEMDSKKLAAQPPAAKPAEAKPRLSREHVRTDGQAAAAAGSNKPPTVLERITRILISPFARRRKDSQRVK